MEAGNSGLVWNMVNGSVKRIILIVIRSVSNKELHHSIMYKKRDYITSRLANLPREAAGIALRVLTSFSTDGSHWFQYSDWLSWVVVSLINTYDKY